MRRITAAIPIRTALNFQVFRKPNMATPFNRNTSYRNPWINPKEKKLKRRFLLRLLIPASLGMWLKESK
jgi:hypothetical protein